MIKAIDLFSGCGGLSLGFTNTGIEIVSAFENWDIALESYNLNFNHPIQKLDLSNTESSIEEISKYSFDMIIGGPPCQDFSHAGKRIEGQRANLTISYAKIIKHFKPIWFVMENVDRAINTNTFSEALKIFKQCGYGLTTIILNACYCGVPQKRKRLFCIGNIYADDDFLKDLLIKNQTKEPLTLREYTKDTLEFEYYYRHPRNYNRRAIYSIDEPAATIRGVNRPIPKEYTLHKNDPVIAIDEIRSLTVEERALIQTFPERFVWYGNKTEVEQMIGNAVPVKLAQYVATQIVEYEKTRDKQLIGKNDV